MDSLKYQTKSWQGFFFFFFVEVDKQILNIYGKENKSKKLKKIKLVLLIEA